MKVANPIIGLVAIRFDYRIGFLFVHKKLVFIDFHFSVPLNFSHFHRRHQPGRHPSPDRRGGLPEGVHGVQLSERSDIQVDTYLQPCGDGN